MEEEEEEEEEMEVAEEGVGWGCRGIGEGEVDYLCRYHRDL